MLHNATLTCDTLIIGGGTVGAAIAGRLAARASETVVLLEAGLDYDRLANTNLPALVVAERIAAWL